MSLIDKYKQIKVSKEEAVVEEVKTSETKVEDIIDEPSKIEGSKKVVEEETKEVSETNDGTNAVQGEKDNSKVSTENEVIEVADTKMRQTAKEIKEAGETVIADEIKIAQQGQDAQIDQTTEPTEGAEETGEETKVDGTQVEPASKELATGSLEAFISETITVLKNNPSLEAQNPFVIQSLRTIDKSRGFDPNKRSYKHFTSLEQIQTALENLYSSLMK